MELDEGLEGSDEDDDEEDDEDDEEWEDEGELPQARGAPACCCLPCWGEQAGTQALLASRDASLHASACPPCCLQDALVDDADTAPPSTSRREGGDGERPSDSVLQARRVQGLGWVPAGLAGVPCSGCSCRH